MPGQMLKNQHLKAEIPLSPPPLFLFLSMACHSIKYLPGQFRSAVPALSPPILLPTPAYCGKKPWSFANIIHKRAKHWRVINTLIATNPKQHQTSCSADILVHTSKVQYLGHPSQNVNSLTSSGPISWAQHATVAMHSIRAAPLQPQAWAQSASHCLCTENLPSRAFLFLLFFEWDPQETSLSS